MADLPENSSFGAIFGKIKATVDAERKERK
jgi:hypothetical protein